MHVLLVSTYELGRQPFGLASPAAWLSDAGFTAACMDLSCDRLREADVREAALVALYLPMHTATRLAVPVIGRVRELNPAAHLCCYGLYAPLNAPFLRSLGVQTILGGEFEADLVALAGRLRDRGMLRALQPITPSSGRSAEADGVSFAAAGGPAVKRPLPRLDFRVPDRAGLPRLERYASLQLGAGERRTVGYTEASRGCRHLCRHCPVVPVYAGRFRVVPREVVMADIRQQVEAGAGHITFGDPDFFNGIGHALAIVEALAGERPGLTYDVTIKIEHLLRHAAHLRRLRETGCLFVTSAVESIDDRVLHLLEKGHTCADFERAVALCRDAGLTLNPTFVPFTPWTSLEGYAALLSAIERLGLIGHVAPIQLAIRLLVPEGSRLLDLPEVRALVGRFDPATLAYPWRHADPRVDALQETIAGLVGARLNAPREDVFAAVQRATREQSGLPEETTPTGPARPRATVPYLNEPWYC